MPAWIYDAVLKLDGDKGPAFAQQSTLNWMQALAFEIEQEHGTDSAALVASFRKVVPRALVRSGAAGDLGNTVEPLVGAVALVCTLRTLALSAGASPWQRPAAVVAWYYALYGGVRSMLASIGQPAADNHGKTMKAYLGCLALRLPHPFNMVAERVNNETYDPLLPTVGGAGPTSRLIEAFNGTRASAQGMLREYLKGTAAYYAARVKDRLRVKHKNGFVTKAARAERDKQLESEIGFMHCAFRYRGKANYRDALYLAYGARDPVNAARFVHHLAFVAEAFVLLAMVVLERAHGRPTADDFANDLSASLRGQAAIAAKDRFWQAII